MSDVRQAMTLAAARGMKLITLHHSERCAEIYCATCGWPEIHRDTVIEQYVLEPYGCSPCAVKAADAEGEKTESRKR